MQGTVLPLGPLLSLVALSTMVPFPIDRRRTARWPIAIRRARVMNVYDRARSHDLALRRDDGTSASQRGLQRGMDAPLGGRGGATRVTHSRGQRAHPGIEM